MRGYFDDKEAEHEEAKERGRDTELTLGAGTLLGIFFGLVLLCGLCFGLGYSLGHRVPMPAAAAQPASQIAAPDEEPLQASGMIPKPSADAQAPAPQAAPGSDGTTGADSSASPAAQAGAGTNGQPGALASAQATAPAAAGPGQPQAQVRPAFPAAANSSQFPQATATPNVHAALPGAVQLMVQVAAVSHEEDAEVLVNALRKRGYAATEAREPEDGLIHVRIGPFTSHEEANRMCTRLLDDGYNALIQP